MLIFVVIDFDAFHKLCKSFEIALNNLKIENGTNSQQIKLVKDFLTIKFDGRFKKFQLISTHFKFEVQENCQK